MESNPLSPGHYSRFKIQPLDFIAENNLDFLQGNVIKYVCRYDAKNGLEDLHKARVYLDKLTARVQAEQQKIRSVTISGEEKGVTGELLPCFQHPCLEPLCVATGKKTPHWTCNGCHSSKRWEIHEQD